ncbi:MAG: DNA recombination protein RmuC [Armatimonadetes bacterium]|nr:DNA recombination protein RmuC [Armatimonadota bacterium]
MSDVVMLAVAILIAAAIVVAAILAARRREHADPGLVVMQQQVDALRAQVGQSLDATARALAERTEALQTQLNTRLEEVTRTVNQRLAESTTTLQQVNESLGQRLDVNLQMVGQRFSETAGMVTTVHEKLKELEEAASRIFEVGRDLTSLQEILKPPKLRGGLGELLLENLLRDRLPEGQFEMQYKFSNGTIVDAVIRLGDRMVPVDSKFPLEGFHAILDAASEEERGKARRDFLRQVQGHVKTIGDKYILPAEGTYDFALMYIPAENIYYEVVVRGDESGGLYTFAMERRVIPVSPTTFYAYLAALVYGLKGLQVEKQAAQIRQGLAQLAMDFEKVRDPLGKLGDKIRLAQQNYDQARRSLDRFADRLGALSGVPLPEAEPQALPLGDRSDEPE